MVDVAVVGLGAMGSAALYHLAGRGVKVVGFDRFRPPHDQGSSTGQTRIIREAYFEHPSYVPLVQRAYEHWAELEAAAGCTLLRSTGGLMIGPPGGTLVEGALRSARTHDLQYEVWDAGELAARVPVTRPDPGTVAVWEPRAGVLMPEACIRAHLTLAERAGAEVRLGEAVDAWEVTADGVVVTTERGPVRADRLLLAGGAWMPELVPLLQPHLTVTRQPLFWFAAPEEGFGPDQLPIYIWEFAPNRFFYGFPDTGSGAKVAIHHEGAVCTPETVARLTTVAERAELQQLLERYLPGLGPPIESCVCMYTNTVDGHFLIDWHPQHPQVLLASPCSGHGFKFSSALGEVLADLLLTGGCAFDLSLFKIPSASAG